MKRELAAALVAFATCWTIGSVAGCSFGDDCDCPLPAPQPEQQAPLPVAFASYDEQGNSAVPPIAPSSASLEVTPDRVFVRYEVGGEAFEIAYRVVGP